MHSGGVCLAHIRMASLVLLNSSTRMSSFTGFLNFTATSFSTVLALQHIAIAERADSETPVTDHQSISKQVLIWKLIPQQILRLLENLWHHPQQSSFCVCGRKLPTVSIPICNGNSYANVQINNASLWPLSALRRHCQMIRRPHFSSSPSALVQKHGCSPLACC